MRFLSLIALLAGCTAQVQSGPSRQPPPYREPREPPPPRGDRTPPPPPPDRQPHDHRPPDRQPEAGWVELAPPQYNEDFRDFIKVGAVGNTTPLRRLRIDVTRGRVRVDQVGIEFMDDGNKNQVVKLGQEVGAGESINVDLDGRARVIRRIVVYVDPAQGRRDRGQYRVFGR